MSFSEEISIDVCQNGNRLGQIDMGVEGVMLMTEVEVNNRRKKYLEELLNAKDDRKVEDNRLWIGTVRNELETEYGRG